MHGEKHELQTVTRAELVLDVGQVIAHRHGTKLKLCCDLGGSTACRDEPQEVDLATA